MLLLSIYSQGNKLRLLERLLLSFTDKKSCPHALPLLISQLYCDVFIIIIPTLQVMQQRLRKNKCSGLEHVDNRGLEVNFEPCIFILYFILCFLLQLTIILYRDLPPKIYYSFIGQTWKTRGLATPKLVKNIPGLLS